MRDPAGDVSIADVLEDDGTEEGGELRAIFYDRRTKLIERLAKKQAASARAKARHAREYAPRIKAAGEARPRVARPKSAHPQQPKGTPGYCKTCWQFPLMEGCSAKCERCAGYNKKVRQLRKEKGQCTVCKGAPRPSRLMCEPCAVEAAAKSRRQRAKSGLLSTRQRRRLAGICDMCEGTRAEGRTKCRPCLDQQVIESRAYRAGRKAK